MSAIDLQLDAATVPLATPVTGTVYVPPGVGPAQISLVLSNKVEIHTLDLAPGPDGRCPFTLPTPSEGPVTYALTQRSAAWSVRCSADGAEPAERALVLTPPVVKDAAEHVAAVQIAPAPAAPAVLPTPVLVGLLVLFSPILLALALLFVPLIAWSIGREELTRTRLRGFALEGPARPVVLDEVFPVVVSFAARRPVHIAQLTVQLEGREFWDQGVGSDRRTHGRTFFTLERHLLEGRVLATTPGGGTVRARVDLAVPEHQVPSTPGGAVRWRIVTTARLKGLPDVRAEVPLQVVPARLAPGTQPPPGSQVEVTLHGVAALDPGAPAPAGLRADLSTRGVKFALLTLAVGGAVTTVGVAVWALLGSPWTALLGLTLALFGGAISAMFWTR